jgi:hypothetical protein
MRARVWYYRRRGATARGPRGLDVPRTRRGVSSLHWTWWGSQPNVRPGSPAWYSSVPGGAAHEIGAIGLSNPGCSIDAARPPGRGKVTRRSRRKAVTPSSPSQPTRLKGVGIGLIYRREPSQPPSKSPPTSTAGRLIDGFRAALLATALAWLRVVRYGDHEGPAGIGRRPLRPIEQVRSWAPESSQPPLLRIEQPPFARRSSYDSSSRLRRRGAESTSPSREDHGADRVGLSVDHSTPVQDTYLTAVWSRFADGGTQQLSQSIVRDAPRSFRSWSSTTVTGWIRRRGRWRSASGARYPR